MTEKNNQTNKTYVNGKMIERKTLPIDTKERKFDVNEILERIKDIPPLIDTEAENNQE